jgi:perosamine synthetase
MYKPFLGRGLLGKEELVNLSHAIEHQTLFRFNTQKSFCSQCEREIAHILGIEHALVITNGTNALKSALVALGPCVGDYVLIPALSFLATASACLTVGLIPIMIDVDASGHMDPVALALFLENNPLPFAVIAVHLDGSSHCRIEAIAQLCQVHELPLIEDTARSFGIFHQGKALGTFGDVGCFSFQENKILSTGEGGALITNNPVLFSKLVAHTDHGAAREAQGIPHWNQDLGFGENFKAHELTGAVLLAQLNKLEMIRKRLREHYYELIRLLPSQSFYDRHDEDIPTAVWFQDSDLIESLKKREVSLISWQSLYLPDHPVIKERRTFYKDGYPWNFLKLKALPTCERGKQISKTRYNLPLPVCPEEFQKLKFHLLNA